MYQEPQPDLIKVEDTNAEALISKISAINKGYFEDKFAKLFVSAQVKKDVLINRGYWLRVYTMRKIITQFLQVNKSQDKQIISLGCGYDTTYFNLMLNRTNNENMKDIKIKYYEMDLESVVKQKIFKISKQQELLNIIQNSPENSNQIEIKENLLKSNNYVLFSGNLEDSVKLQKDLESLQINYEIPTLIFVECVLTYIKGEYVDQLLKYFYSKFDLFIFMDYEMYNPNDPFGKMMVQNFMRKGCPLLGINDFPNLQVIKKRYESYGFQDVEIYSLIEIYNKYVDKDEKKRIEKIEFLDEFEEWNVFLDHYFVSVMKKVSNKLNSDDYVNRVKLNDQEKK